MDSLEPSPDPPSRTASRALLLLTLLGLAVRLAFLVLEPRTRPVADETTWIGWSIEGPDGIASERVRFSPVRTGIIFHPPLFPYFIGLAWTLFGTLTAAKVFQAIAGTLLVPAVGRLAFRAVGERAGLAAAAVTALYPELVWYSVHFWSEPLFVALLWWGFERVVAADVRERLAPALAAGALWGLAALTRETALYFVPFAALWLACRRKGGAGRAAALVLAALLAVAPWTYRNWRLFRAFVPVSTMGGLNVWQGNAHLTRDQVYAEYEAVQGRIAQYEYARRKGLEVILERQPAWLFEKIADQMPRFWEIDSFALLHIQRGAYGPVRPAVARLANLVVNVPYLAVLALFVVAVAVAPMNRARWLLLLFTAYYVSLHMVTYGYSRFRVPLLPVLFLAAAAAWVAWRDGRLTALGPSRKALACAVAVGLALCFPWSVKRNLEHPVYGFTDPGAPPPDLMR